MGKASAIIIQNSFPLKYLKRLFIFLIALMLLGGSLFAGSIYRFGFQPALATGGNTGSFTHSSVSDFNNACTVQTGVRPVPLLSGTVLGNLNGGEVRLAATLEDHFNGSSVNPALWLTGSVYDWYPSQPSVSGGVLNLDSAYLRSQANFQPYSVRFFEARAIVAVNPPGVRGWPDLGYYRALPPEVPGSPSPVTPDTAIRLFVFPDSGPSYARGRDGDESNPLVDINIEDVDWTTYHTYRIEWDISQARFYVDNALQATIAGNSLLNTYVFLYHQDPITTGTGRGMLRVDWVRAGQYPVSGSYTSCVQDAGGMVNFSTMNVTSTIPSGSSLVVETRTQADTAGAQWTDWTALNGNQVISPSGRYFQYRLMYTSNQVTSPEVQSVTVNYYGPVSLALSPASVTLDPGEQQQFVVTASDVNGRPMTGLVYSWSIVNSGGTITQNGLFTAGLAPATYSNTVRVATALVGGGSLTRTATVTVTDNGLPPVVDPGGPYSGPEGSNINLNATAIDPEGGPVSGYAWDLDSNPDFETPGQSVTMPGRDDGTYQVRVRAFDADMNQGVATVNVVFANVAPTITGVIRSPANINEGASSTITVGATDPWDSLEYEYSCDGDTIYEIGPQSSPSTNCFFGDNGTYTVRVRVTDGDGGEDIDTSASVTVNNVAPNITNVNNNGLINEGSSATITVTVVDPGSEDILLYEFDCDENGIYEVLPQTSNSGTCLFAQDGSYDVGVRVTDGDGGVDTETTSVLVQNVVPTIVSVVNNGPKAANQPVAITITATDPGTNDILVFEFDCDNNGMYEISGAFNQAICTFAFAGNFIVPVRVLDDDSSAINSTEIDILQWLVYLPMVSLP